jgi:hypothetical protein
MLKSFLLHIFLLFLLTLSLHAKSKYSVNLAVFKNSYSLHKQLTKLPPKLKKTTRTYRRNGKTHAYTLPTQNKQILKKLLPAYKKVFKDAYIVRTKRKY